MSRRRLAPLPPPPPDFVGRKAERRRLTKLWPASRLVAIVGPGGIGKTALARRIADDLAQRRAAWTGPVASGFLHAAEHALALDPLPTGTPDRVLRLAERLDRRALVLCVDDVHLQSPDERAAMLATASQLRRGKLLVTSRTPIELGELAPASVVVELGPLAPAEAATLVQHLLERFGKEGDAKALAGASAGSPQWCGLLAGGGKIGDRIADVISAATQPEQEALALLAVAGGAWEPERLGLDAAVLDALEARFLVERGAGRTVGLHDLVRETVLSDLPAGRLAPLARRAAEACREAGDLAAWLRHLEAAGDRVAMADALAQGADAWLSSQIRGTELLRLVAWVESAGVPVSPRLQLRRTLALVSMGRTADALRWYRAIGAVDPEDAVLHAAVEVRILREQGASVAARRKVLVSALQADAPAAHPADRGDLVLGWVWECMHRGDWDEAIATCRRAVSGIDRVDPISVTRAARILAELLLERGEPEGAAAMLAEAEARATRLGSATLRAFVEGTFVQLHVRHGSLADARRRLARMEAIPLAPDDVRLHASRSFRRAEVLARSGRVIEAVRELEACETANPVIPIGLRCTLWALLCGFAIDAGEPERAARVARALLSVPRPQRPWHFAVEAPMALAAVALGQGRTGVAGRRARLAAAKAARAGLWERAARATLIAAEVEIAEGRPETAQAWSAAIAQLARAAAASVLEARAEIVHAASLRALGRATAARDRAAAALAAAEASGHTLLAERARALLDRLATPVAAVPGEHDLWMDVRTARVVVDGRRALDFSARPLLARLLRHVLERSGEPVDKGDLFAGVWQLPYRPARDATVYKAVARLARELDPEDPRRFLRWDADGRLALVAERPHLAG